MKEINLEAILENNHYDPSLSVEEPYNKKLILQAMKEACEQVLDVAAEEAEVEGGCDEEGNVISASIIYSDDYKYGNNFDSLPSFEVNKESILKIKERLL